MEFYKMHNRCELSEYCDLCKVPSSRMHKIISLFVPFVDNQYLYQNKFILPSTSIEHNNFASSYTYFQTFTKVITPVKFVWICLYIYGSQL